MLDFRNQTFLSVCRHMNFTRASQELHITQPAVSQHIRFLEQLYQTSLFLREGKHIRLTPAGEILLATMTQLRNDERGDDGTHARMRRRKAHAPLWRDAHHWRIHHRRGRSRVFCNPHPRRSCTSTSAIRLLYWSSCVRASWILPSSKAISGRTPMRRWFTARSHIFLSAQKAMRSAIPFTG